MASAPLVNIICEGSETSRLNILDLIVPIDENLRKLSHNIISDDTSKRAVKNQIPNMKKNVFEGL